jgi:hypothetical protein
VLTALITFTDVAIIKGHRAAAAVVITGCGCCGYVNVVCGALCDACIVLRISRTCCHNGIGDSFSVIVIMVLCAVHGRESVGLQRGELCL